jgi:hypothetical protein
MGNYRAVLELPAGELPFGLEILPEGAATVGYLVNGKERVKLNEVAVSGAHLEIRMPGYENRLSADAKGGRLSGEVVLSRPGGKQQHIPLHAEHGHAFRFFEASADGRANVAGRWAITFTGDDGKQEAAVGEFAQVGDVVEGTFLPKPAIIDSSQAR